MFEHYPEYESLFARVQLVLFMLGMGATLTPDDFVRVVRQPRSFLLGVGCQFLVTPLLAYLIGRWTGVEPGFAVGLVLVAAMPGGTLSKLFTWLGKGNLALSISLTACGTLAAIGTVPVLMRVLAAEYVPEGFGVPVAEVVLDVGLYLVLPLAVGMVIGRYAVARRHAFSRWCIRLGLLAVVAMVVGSIGSGRVHAGEYGWRGPLVLIFFCLLAQQVSMLPFRLLGWPRPDTLSVGVEVTFRNLNLALLLKAILFPATEKGIDPIADGVLFVILAYAVVALGVGIPLVLNFRRLARRDARRAAEKAKVGEGGA